MNRNWVDRGLGCVLLGLGCCAWAGETAPPIESAPSADLLEFLGAWQTPEGDAVDPLQWLDTDPAPDQTASVPVKEVKHD